MGHPRFERTDVTDQQVCSELKHASLDMFLTMKRLSMLPLLLEGPAYLRAIHCVEPKPQHAYLLLEDIIRLWEHTQDLNLLPSPAVAPTPQQPRHRHRYPTRSLACR